MASIMDKHRYTIEAERHSFTHRSYQYLYALCLRAPSIINLAMPSLFRLMSGIASYFDMNDLEIVVWAIYLDRFGWMEYLKDNKSLEFCAYTAIRYMKKHNNDSIHDNPWDEYGVWLESKERMIDINNPTLNFYFRDLYYEEPLLIEYKKMDFNDLVTGILESTFKDKTKRCGSDSDENFKL